MTVPFRRQVVLVFRRDVLLEARGGEALLVAVPTGAVALVLLAVAVGADTPLLRQLAPGALWLVVLLFGVLVTQRQTAVESPPQRDTLNLLGVDPIAKYLGRVAASLMLLLALEAALVPVVVALYSPPLTGWIWLLLAGPLVAAGLAALGTMVDGLTASSVQRLTLAPLLVLPLSLPLLLAGTQVIEAATYTRPVTPWLLLAVAVDLVALLAGLFSAAVAPDSP